tara:strand:+ start:462 stop:1670 length:1209 start_codon:yes stop_codon:yes gene_type:complete
MIGRNTILIKFYLIFVFVVFSSCSSKNAPKKQSFLSNPVAKIDYTFKKNKNQDYNLNIYYEIDCSSFMYEKDEKNKYFANVDVIFQLIEPKSQNEIDRKLSELTIFRDSFDEIRNKNFHNGKIDFIVNSHPLELNIKVIDLKTKSFWSKNFKIDINDDSKLISNLILYYQLDTQNKIINDSVDENVSKINCKFDYTGFSDSKKINVIAYNAIDTIFNEVIFVNEFDTQYEIEIPINQFELGNINVKVSDGESNSMKIFSKVSSIASNFWLNDTKIIRTVMRYILPFKVYKKSKSMTDTESLIFFKNYWKKLDPEQSTDENELLIELDQRLKKVNSRFQEMSTDGWNTERGRIYIIYGEPNSIRTERNPNSNNIRELWSYQNGKIFIFEENSFGRFYLINNEF